MKITVLGSGSAFSDPSRFNSAYLVESEDQTFLIDCGSDALRALQKAKTDLFSIGDIFLTHLHADHSGGLPAVLTAMHVLDRKSPVEVHVPSTQLEFVRLWLANLFIYNRRMSFETTLVPIHAGTKKLNAHLEIEFIPTKHLQKYAEHAAAAEIKPLSFSVIVREGNNSFFFSSDFGSINEVRSYLECSLALVEATHPNIEDIAEITKRPHGRIFLTHIPQELEIGGKWRSELYSKFNVEELNVVHDGQVFTI